MASKNYSGLDQLYDDTTRVPLIQHDFLFHTLPTVIVLTALRICTGTWSSSRRRDVAIVVGVLVWKHRTYLGIAALTGLPPPAKTAYWICGSLIALFMAFCIKAYVESITARDTNPALEKCPWLLPSRTIHTRLFPKHHSFSYSYLQIAVPVGSEGRFGSLISIGDVKKQGWFHVQASDYLDPNSDDKSLESKLSSYLRSQGIEDNQWNHAYLLTAPRFLGYAFNPVSFWYIYDNANALTMMILEVNNTFDERRMYLLDADKSEELFGKSHDEVTVPGTEITDAPKFKNAWRKDFHVSPFNSRKGYYMLSALDPFQRPKYPAPTFDNTITLKSSKEHVKLVARVFSQGQAINPVTSSRWQILRFVCSWFWVGFVTFPRIIREAGKLFFKRRLNVWFRPEVLPTTIGRREEKTECDIASFFETYLQAIVIDYDKPVRLNYISNIRGFGTRELSNIPSSTKPSDANASDLEIRVLSPAFFARLVHYSHSNEALDRECVFTDEKNRTIWVSRPDVLSDILKASSKKQSTLPAMGCLERLRWIVHRKLRCPPPSPAYAFSNTLVRAQDIRASTFSPLDKSVMASCPEKASIYRGLCARLFLAQRFAFGFVGVVDSHWGDSATDIDDSCLNAIHLLPLCLDILFTVSRAYTYMDPITRPAANAVEAGYMHFAAGRLQPSRVLPERDSVIAKGRIVGGRFTFLQESGL